MNRTVFFAGLTICLLLPLAAPVTTHAQLDLFSKDQRIEFTPEWHGERFPDGRPNVADAVLARLKDVTADEAWDVLQDAGYRNQFEGGWKEINLERCGVRRVVPSFPTPRPPDVAAGSATQAG